MRTVTILDFGRSRIIHLYNGQLYGPYTADAVAARNGTYCDILMFPRQGESWSDYLSRMESHVWDN